jgi:hypothetical protein
VTCSESAIAACNSPYELRMNWSISSPFKGLVPMSRQSSNDSLTIYDDFCDLSSFMSV